MKFNAHFLRHWMFSFLSGAIVASAFVTFALAHWFAYQRTGEWSLLLLCFSESLSASFLLIRKQPETISDRNFDWLVAIAGSFTPLLFRPASWGVFPLMRYAAIAGIVIQILGLISLNRSFALVASKRNIKTSGLYGLVRHPLYCSYLITFSSYLLVNTSIQNVVVYFVLLLTIFIRCQKEEAHLKSDPEYSQYMKVVNYRLIPFIY